MSFEIKSNLEWNGSTASIDFDKATTKALIESAILVEGIAKVQHKWVNRSGDLARSIKRSPKTPKDKVFVGTNSEYAPYLEFGTRFHKPYPFLRPAFSNHLKI